MGVSEAAQLLELVDDLPFGIHTHVGENGINLSGGQRRIALARAFTGNHSSDSDA